jgi:cytochrome c biogenesis protein
MAGRGTSVSRCRRSRHVTPLGDAYTVEWSGFRRSTWKTSARPTTRAPSSKGESLQELNAGQAHGLGRQECQQQGPEERRPERQLQAARQDRPGARVPELHAAGDHRWRHRVPGRHARQPVGPSATCAFRPTTAQREGMDASARRAARSGTARGRRQRYARARAAARPASDARAAASLGRQEPGHLRRRRQAGGFVAISQFLEKMPAAEQEKPPTSS